MKYIVGSMHIQHMHGRNKWKTGGEMDGTVRVRDVTAVAQRERERKGAGKRRALGERERAWQLLPCMISHGFGKKEGSEWKISECSGKNHFVATCKQAMR